MPKKIKRLPTLLEVQKLIAARPESVTLAMLAVAARSSEDWVLKLSKGEIASPGYPAVVAIYEFLSQRTTA